MDTRARLALAAAFTFLPLVPLAVQLARLQVMEHKSLESRASSEFNRSLEEVTPRADIVDRDGKILAQSLQVWAAFLDKNMSVDCGAAASKLADLVGLPAAEVLRRCRAPERFAWLSKTLSYEQSQALTAAKVEGLGIAPSQSRFYPNDPLARNVLGQLSADGRGISGLELTLDRRLRGKPRRFKLIRDGSGRTIYKSLEIDGRAPEPVQLTLDRNVQFYAEEALREAFAQYAMAKGVVVVQDPRDGEILAMAAYPPDPLRNPIVQDTFEPGSTFKLVTAAAALEEGAVGAGETFDCENGSYEVAPGVSIHDHEPSGALTLQGILERSSNIGIAKVVERVGALRFYRYSRAFGFANKTGIALPGETSGEMKPLSDMTKVALAAASYGYGIGVSPLQVLSAYSAVANGGTLWEPSLIKDGQRPVRVRRVISEKTVPALTQMLEGVVERGTGTPAQISGYSVAGKTGTSRQLDRETGRYSVTRYNASFVGFLPASAPRWTILVVISDPKGQYYGAQVAAPVFAKLGRRLLTLNGIAPDRPLRAAGVNSRGPAR
ncbi:MAG: penicillin-binding protein 2 [Elusimicrobia bacterium]|nr:penicillin-binding protein 2 [Elusimicrobiota bacterium]